MKGEDDIETGLPDLPYAGIPQSFGLPGFDALTVTRDATNC
jgi:hypothetical protein